MQSRYRVTQRQILFISFLLPVIIMGSYFAYRSMAPFGQSSLLTVDLGQQYIDFFSYFRRTLLHHPSEFFYSFSKGLGGEMWGTNAYYLWSPLNLILVFFPAAHLSSGVLVLTLLRYGLAGLTFAWLIIKTKLQHGVRILGFSTAYALNGWIIANQLNLLWLDAMIILPLIIWGVHQLILRKRVGCYISWLAVMIIDNYYMAWMICLFTILFFIWQLPLLQNWRGRLIAFGRYAVSSIIAVGISGLVLLPTIYALLQSKGTYTNNHIRNHFEYNPLKLLAKLVPGSFNFNQMPSGQANIYVGMLMMFGFGLYLLNKQIRLSQRLIAGLITIFLILSFCYEPLDLLWHIGQFPVWYPSRFSFIFCFWIIFLAANCLQTDFRPQRWQLICLLVITVAIFIYVETLSVSYINNNQKLIGLGLALVSLFFLGIPRAASPVLNDLLLVLIVICDVSTSAFTALNQISYVSQPEFGEYTTALNAATDKIKQYNQDFYRVAKTFMRTKDDPLQSGFNGGDHFGSTIVPALPNFMGAIGQPAGDGFVSYDNGTQVSDSFLGFRYTMAVLDPDQSKPFLPLSGYRPDWNSEQPVAVTHNIGIRQNKDALPIAYGANTQILKLKHDTYDPTAYQSEIYQALAGSSRPLFEIQNFNQVDFQNVQSAKQITGTVFKKKDRSGGASIKLEFIPTTNDSYYLTVGPNVKDDASITVNNRHFAQYQTYRDTVIMNVAHNQKGKKVTITFHLKHSSVWLQNVSLYRLNQQAFNRDLKVLQRSPLKLKRATATTLQGSVNLKKDQSVLMTTIPYDRGWHATVDGKTAKCQKVLGTFIALKLSPGTHQVTLHYRPPFLILGTIISLISLGLAVVFTRFTNHRLKIKNKKTSRSAELIQPSGSFLSLPML